jgi:translocator protein
MKKWWVLAGLIGLCLGGGMLSSLATMQSIAEWYPALNKPVWTPPNWMFAPVWTVLYIMMAVAAWLVWQAGNARTAMILFFGQLALNISWSLVFFGAQSVFFGMINVVLMWLAIAATIFAFARHSRPAAYLMVPYLGWVSIATALNAAILMMN